MQPPGTFLGHILVHPLSICYPLSGPWVRLGVRLDTRRTLVLPFTNGMTRKVALTSLSLTFLISNIRININTGFAQLLQDQMRYPKALHMG